MHHKGQLFDRFRASMSGRGASLIASLASPIHHRSSASVQASDPLGSYLGYNNSSTSTSNITLYLLPPLFVYCSLIQLLSPPSLASLEIAIISLPANMATSVGGTAQVHPSKALGLLSIPSLPPTKPCVPHIANPLSK